MGGNINLMGKKDYQLFADTLSQITEDTEREKLISFLLPIFKADNQRFSEDRFRDWIIQGGC